MEWFVVIAVFVVVVVAGAFIVRLATSSRRPPREGD